MFKINGCSCEKCNEKFDKASDVVVCPECGTPHHRECWKALGHCINQEKHSEGFEWQAPDTVVNAGDVLCPKCQTPNNKDMAFCENCGTSLKIMSQQSQSIPADIMAKAQAIQPNLIMPKSLEGEINGVSLKDIAVYIGTNAPYYLFKFKRTEKEGKTYKPFCFSAFLFDGFYFLYRKMWWQSIVILIISLFLSIPSFITLQAELGLIPATSPLIFEGISTVTFYASWLSFAFKIFLGFWAIPAYQKKAVKDLKQLKKNLPSDNMYYQALVARSGPSKAVLLGGLVLLIFYMFS